MQCIAKAEILKNEGYFNNNFSIPLLGNIKEIKFDDEGTLAITCINVGNCS